MYVKSPYTVPTIKLTSKYVFSFLSSFALQVDFCFLYFANAVKWVGRGRLAEHLCELANLGVCFMLRASLEATGVTAMDFQSYIYVCIIQFNRDLLNIYDMPELFWGHNNEKKRTLPHKTTGEQLPDIHLEEFKGKKKSKSLLSKTWV